MTNADGQANWERFITWTNINTTWREINFHNESLCAQMANLILVLLVWDRDVPFQIPGDAARLQPFFQSSIRGGAKHVWAP